jgi:hypothetical protein
MNVVTWIVHIALIVLQLLILRYVTNLERTGCACATDNWRRDYIIVYLAVSILLATVHFIMMASSSGTDDVRKVIILPPLLMFVLGWLYVIFTLQYVDKLRKDKCECSESVYRIIMETIAIINALVVTVSLLISVSAAVVLYVTHR